MKMELAGMRPLAEFPLEQRRRVRFVLTDIDDTLTDDGHLRAEAYGALERLHDAGFIVVPVTGRPAGWCDHIARMWPVDGVVGENGALYFRYNQTERKMISQFWRSENQRRGDRIKLDQLRQQILSDVPGTGIASDQPYREADLAIDFCEDVAPLPETDIDRIVALFTEAGAQAKVSSIHVNGWFGDYDKLSMTRRLLAEQFDTDMDAVRDIIVFSGDSPNDAPMFGFFPNAVGVANVLNFSGRLEASPAWVTPSPGGAGFTELANALLAARQ